MLGNNEKLVSLSPVFINTDKFPPKTPFSFLNIHLSLNFSWTSNNLWFFYLNLRSKNKNQIVWYRLKKLKFFITIWIYIKTFLKTKTAPLITQLTSTNSKKCLSSCSDFSVLSMVSKSKITVTGYLLSMQSNQV